MRLDVGDLKAKADEKVYNAKHAFSSWQAFVEWVQVPDTALDQVSIFLCEWKSAN